MIQVCCWNVDEAATYHTGCGHMFVLNDGTPRQNGMRFCCYCGHALRTGRLYPQSRRAKPPLQSLHGQEAK